MLDLRELPGGVLAVSFRAMASPCELLLSGLDRQLALELGAVVAAEAWRIEAKFSRYRPDSVVSRIHQQRGALVQVDEETASLLDFAARCFELSDGLFDITCGPLRRVWNFDGSDRLPAPQDVEKILPVIGFNRLSWTSPWLGVPPEMEIDFGGIGKEYAVDRAYDLMRVQCPVPFLVNFGGDLRVGRPLGHGPWKVGIERPDSDGQAAMMLEIEQGGLATSGDSHRFVMKDGVRYGHILDPRTGWPVPDAPRSVTVAASSCTEAGLLSTLAVLNGKDAEQFLEQQAVRFWVLR